MNKTLASAAMLAALLALGACDKKTDTTTTAPADTMASTPSMAASDSSVTTTPAPMTPASDAASGSMGASSAP